MHFRYAAALVAGALLLPHMARAQRVVGYSPEAAAAQRAAEAAAIARPDATRAEQLSKALSVRPHVAGTDAQDSTRDYVIGVMRALGMQTEVRTYAVWMPHPTSIRAWRVSPEN